MPRLRGLEKHNCSRPCTSGTGPKRCSYSFFVEEVPVTARSCSNLADVKNGQNTTCSEMFSDKSNLVINGRSPGPAIEVCLGDTVEIFVYNKLKAMEVSFHWHGIIQKGSTHMDGVAMITQCPILPYSAFRYAMKLETPGTYFYYAHAAPQQGDGLYGSLVVRKPDDNPSLEKTLMFSARSSTPLTHFSILNPQPIELLVNGQTGDKETVLNSGRRYKLRLINANVFNCPISFSIAKHHLEVVAIDASPLQKITSASHVIMFPGERFDVIVETNQPPGKYLMLIQGLQSCEGLFYHNHFTYGSHLRNLSTINDQRMYFSQEQLATLEHGFDCHRLFKNVICAHDMKVAHEEAQDEAQETFYVSFDVNHFNDFTDDMTDYNFKIYEIVNYPSYLSISAEGANIPQIGGMTFKYPSSPILSQEENTPKELVCTLESRSDLCSDTPLFCECLQILEIPAKKTVDIVLLNEGFGSNISFTFHSHGHNVNVIGRGSFEKPISKEEIKSLDNKEQLHRNSINPLKKDSFVVPSKGYVILRFHADNLGYWLWEVRSTAIAPMILGPGMQFLMRVGTSETIPIVPIDFPTCGSNKGPALIFESDD
ncbi:laccase-9 isoform X2 [Orussus abietinus]|uniref:laccase-9 isoform X2 n=1 Tax=Orussus abietinus TaxID=222816 RepID=UPI00062512EF|nr:laccase-9 isoform X2 [Orussus abietinus]